jgi:hypothetical protein
MDRFHGRRSIAARRERAAPGSAELDGETLDEQIRLALIPAPPFEEAERATTWRALREIGLEEIRTDEVGNVSAAAGLRRRLPEGRTLLTAHLDTVFPAETPVRRGATVADPRPGITDNARGLAALLGRRGAHPPAAWDPVTPLWFVATVGEEGRGRPARREAPVRGRPGAFGEAALCLARRVRAAADRAPRRWARAAS